jgi:hypothetical protein
LLIAVLRLTCSELVDHFSFWNHSLFQNLRLSSIWAPLPPSTRPPSHVGEDSFRQNELTWMVTNVKSTIKRISALFRDSMYFSLFHTQHPFSLSSRAWGWAPFGLFSPLIKPLLLPRPSVRLSFDSVRLTRYCSFSEPETEFYLGASRGLRQASPPANRCRGCIRSRRSDSVVGV